MNKKTKRLVYGFLVASFLVVSVFVLMNIFQPNKNVSNINNQEPIQNNNQDTQKSLYTFMDVAKHNTKEDCWFIVDNKVYDVSKFIAMGQHPPSIELGCGKEASSLFKERRTVEGEIIGTGTPHSSNAENILKNYYIGDVLGSVREFSMTSFTEIIDGKYFPQYSIKEINVKKGDLVRIKINVTSGKHDFKIDEFDVYVDTIELNKEYFVEFIADKTGNFTYYCTKPGHRQNGHWGTLIVSE